MSILQTITKLSHEFGTSDYVRGGGGNTSCKDEHTLWVKPSGTTLSGLTPETFVALDRAKLAELYTIEPPTDSSARESLVKEKMEQSVLPETPGRASVEAPLHDSLSARYVVHTHPFIVNGMTCSANGRVVCNELFPSALWLDYIDPGYTLCMKVREAIQDYNAQHGREPSLIFLKNHGVFVAADEPDEIRRLYAHIMSALKFKYDQAGCACELSIGPEPNESRVAAAERAIREAMQKSDLSIAISGFFDVPSGPISPDHIVYAKSYALFGQPTLESVSDFQSKHGYRPQVISFNHAVYSVAETDKKAVLALELAQDGALVEKLAAVFGGIDYMTDAAREFIENWEVESYRQKQM
ncbi:MAG: class II aldolase/adducin family protein [Planctomycetota bacterium]